MTTFKGDTRDGIPHLKIRWKEVIAECAKYRKFCIKIWDEESQEEISEQQRKWLHCKAGPIRELVRLGWSFKDAKIHLKIAHGRQWFVRDVTEENFKRIKGELFWECQIATCRKLIHPAIVEYRDERRICPFCHSHEIKLIAIKSIMDKTVKTINKWFREIFNAYPKIKEPNPDWNKDEKKKE